MTITSIIILVSACLNAITALSSISIKIKLKLKLKSQIKQHEKAKKEMEQKLFNAWKKEQKKDTFDKIYGIDITNTKNWGKCEPDNDKTKI